MTGLLAGEALGQGAAVQKFMSVPNSTFEPTVSCDGPPVFDLPCLVPLASPILVDYCLVQANGVVTQTWRDALEGAGAAFLESHSVDALLVSMPDGE